MLEPDELDENELNYLLGLASSRRRKRERELARMLRVGPRDGQTRHDYQAAKGGQEHALEWARRVEDHLIQLVAEVDATLLRDHHVERLAELERTAA